MQDLNEELSSVSPLQPHPLVFDLTRLQNCVQERENELAAAQSEIKALRVTETLKEKALQQLKSQHDKLDEKLEISERLLHHKNWEMKKLTDEKKDALAAQFAAEAALTRLHTTLKDDDPPPIEAIVAPLEAHIKMYQTQIASLIEDNKTLDRLTKSKEAALLETEKILRSALERALAVEDVQNHNFDLRRQLQICVEENRLLEKTNRQKVVQVEKLGLTIQQLEEALLSGAASANTVRDYKRQISELNDEKRVLERELARAKVSANRVAAVVANEWKDENKVMPVRQWLEERKVLQAEMQRFKDKLSVTERTAKAEAQLKDKFKLRLKILEDGLKHDNLHHLGTTTSPKPYQNLGFLSKHTGPRKRSSSQPRGSSISNRSSPLHHTLVGNCVYGESKTKTSLWPSKKGRADHCGEENSELTASTDKNAEMSNDTNTAGFESSETKEYSDDMVSGFLYDRLQKEFISLRKICQAKDDELSLKDDEITILQRKVDALSKSIQVEARKGKKETSVGHRVTVSPEQEDTQKIWRKGFLRRVTKSS
ncbi:microtubule-associated protein 70-5 isoform X2 [Silene latifolia]